MLRHHHRWTTNGNKSYFDEILLRGRTVGYHCRHIVEGGVLRGRFETERRPLQHSVQKRNLTEAGTALRGDRWNSRICLKRSAEIADTTGDTDTRGGRCPRPIGPIKFDFATLFQHSGGTSDDLKQQGHYLLLVRLQTCSKTR